MALLYKVGAGFALALALLFGAWLYGNQRDQEGFDRRDVIAVKESAARQVAAVNEQKRLENAKHIAEQRYQDLKKDTATRVADLDALVRRLRKQLPTAGNQHASTTSPSRADGTNTDWIGLVGTCWGDYAELGKEAATYADRVNGLQDYVRAVRE